MLITFWAWKYSKKGDKMCWPDGEPLASGFSRLFACLILPGRNTKRRLRRFSQKPAATQAKSMYEWSFLSLFLREIR